MIAKRLYLTSFEHLMVAQDSPAYPCVVFCRMQFTGKLDRDVFIGALRKTLDRHPMLRSHVARSWRGLYWLASPSQSVPIEWTRSENKNSWVSDSRLDLFEEPATKVFVDEASDACEIVFQCHHACVDGLGLQLAVEDLWLLYDGTLSGQKSELPEYKISLLPNRNRFGISLTQIPRILRQQKLGLVGIKQFLVRKPVAVIPHRPVLEDKPDLLSACCHIARFEKKTVEQFRIIAKNRRATLNELLMCCIFEAIADFRLRHRFQNPDEWIRMMVPISMRSTDQDAQQTACNIVSSVFLDRMPSQIETSESLLESLHWEMDLIKKNRLGLIFIASLWVRKYLATKRTSANPARRCETSVVVTNLGRSFSKYPLLGQDGTMRTGKLILKNITMLAPMTPFLASAFTINEYAGNLFLALRYDHRVFPEELAKELLDLVVAKSTDWSSRPLNLSGVLSHG